MVGDRETETERQRDRETERQRDRGTEGQRDRGIERSREAPGRDLSLRLVELRGERRRKNREENTRLAHRAGLCGGNPPHFCVNSFPRQAPDSPDCWSQ